MMAFCFFIFALLMISLAAGLVAMLLDKKSWPKGHGRTYWRQ
jgi:hypothetical protein